MTPFLSIIIPAFNEENRIHRALDASIEYLKKQKYTSEIIVVSDGSTDRTKETAEEYTNKYPALSVIEYSPNRGKGYAVKTGMLAAKGEYRLFMDADYAVPIEYAGKFLEKAMNGSEIVIGSRGLEESVIETHQQFIREKMAQLFGLLQRSVLKLPFIDTQCGFKLFKQNTAELLFNKITYDCSYFDTELLYIAYYNRIKIEEFPVKWKHDKETRMPIGLKRSLDLFLKLFRIKKIHSSDIKL